MCLASKPKVQPIAPPPAPPPPASETTPALREAGASSRTGYDLGAKRRGRAALRIDRPVVTGIASPSNGSGLSV